jgi:hypothetical protein
MDIFFEKILIPILVGVATPLIAKGLVRVFAPDKTLGWKAIVGIGVVVMVVAAIVISLLAPYKVTGISWCLRADGTVRVTGRLARTILGSSVPGYAVQTKIYEAGRGDPPFKSAKFATTGVDGTFTTEFPPPAPIAGTPYLINTAYKYDTFLSKERWEISDFGVGDPPSCANP